MKTALLLLAAVLVSSWPARAETNALEQSIVEVLVTYQGFDPHFPWRRDRPSLKAGYGVVIGKGRVITTEDLVRGHTLIELRRPRNGTKSEASVLQADYQTGAALLEFRDPVALDALKPAAFAGRVGRDEKVQIVQLDDSGQIQSGAGHVAEISVERLPSAPASVLTCKVLTDLKIAGNGAPVLYNGKLAGLVLRFERDTQTSLVLPSVVISRFVDDVDHPPYKGVSSAGIQWVSLVDPVKRVYLGLDPADSRGVLVLRTLPQSGAAQALRTQDVIVEWGGHPIDSQGYYDDPEYGRLLLSYAIGGRTRPGEKVPVTIIRNRKRMTTEVELGRFSDAQSYIPENVTGAQPEYLVDGGFVIRELSADYLYAYGGKWMVSANPRLVNAYLTRAQMPAKAGEHMVILSSVLPDPINVGYAALRDDVVTAVNGEPVANLADVFKIAARDGGVQRLTLQGSGLDVVLDAMQLPDANLRLVRQYRIPEPRFQRGAAKK